MPLWNFVDSGTSIFETCTAPTIKDFRQEKDYTVYIIEVYVEGYSWTVERRYRDFLEYDKKRFKHLKQSFLPRKKLLGNQDVEFIKKRLTDLDRYLKTVFELEVMLQKKDCCSVLPSLLAKFLDFHRYEVRGICEQLAEECSSNNEQNLSANSYYELSPMHLHAITERLKIPENTCGSSDVRLNFSNVLDFTHRLQNLKIKGSNVPYGSSNIIPNLLEFSLSCFKALKSLWITDCNTSMIRDLCNCRQTVRHLTVHRSLNSLSEIILDRECCINDQITLANSSSQIWTNIKVADLSFNSICCIDKSVMFWRTVETLNLTGNRLSGIDHLQHLTFLTDLDLSHNIIDSITDWHKNLGNIKRLSLMANKIKSIEGMSRLYSLEQFDVRFNRLLQPTDLRPLSRLPCLCVLLLAGNPLDASIEYRSRALEEAFGDRAGDVRLDDQPTSQRELDAVGIRLAIRRAKEERECRLVACREQMTRTLNFGLDAD